MGKSKDLATLKDSGLSIDGTLTTTSTGTNLTSNSYNVVKIQTDKDDNGSNDDAILQFTTGSSNTVKGELRYDESENMFEIGHGDNQGHIRVDSSGRVLTPSQPAFRAYDNETVTNNGVIVFDTVNQRGGTNYSTSNGRFTCPVSGWYHFHFKYLSNSNDTRNDCSFYKNGSVYVEQRNYKSNGNHESYDVVAVDYFNANDYITCNVVYGDVYNFPTWSSWYGYLIG